MIKIITGPMFSGKSEQLIANIELYKNKYKNIKYFKPNLDTRDKDYIKTRASNRVYKATLIKNLSDIKNNIDKDTELVVIDEAQFLKGNIAEITDLYLKNIDFLIAGLSSTSDQQPFGIMPDILSIATDIIVLKAKCVICGDLAEFTKTDDKKLNTIDCNLNYFPVCRKCMKLCDEEK